LLPIPVSTAIPRVDMGGRERADVVEQDIERRIGQPKHAQERLDHRLLQLIKREIAARDGIRPNVRGRRIDIAIGIHGLLRCCRTRAQPSSYTVLVALANRITGRGDLRRGAVDAEPHGQVGAPRPSSVANLNYCLFRPLPIKNRIGRENSSGVAPQSGTGLSTMQIDCSAILTIG
jgi:hypothetical protein